MSDMHHDERYRKAQKRVKELRDFYVHIAVYIAANLMLLIVNLVTSPDALWFYWVTIFWGFGLVFHGISVFFEGKFLGSDWEDRKIKKMIQRGEGKR